MQSNKVLTATLDELVAQRELTVEQANLISARYDQNAEVAPSSRKTVISEAVTYIGAAVIVISAALILSQAWDQLGRWGRPAIVFGSALVLTLAAVGLGRQARIAERRRLASAMLVGSSALYSFATGLLVNELLQPINDPNYEVYIQADYWVAPVIMLSGAVVGLACSIFGYRFVPSYFGLFGVAVALGLTALASGWLVWALIKGATDYPFLGFVFLLVTGFIWTAAAAKGKFAQRDFAIALGLLAIFVGTEGIREPMPEAFAPIALVLFGLLATAFHSALKHQNFLAAGIAYLLVGGVELLNRYVEGVRGAMASMAFGIVMLLIGLQLFKEKKSES